jgi:hypothetical protein
MAASAKVFGSDNQRGLNGSSARSIQEKLPCGGIRRLNCEVRLRPQRKFRAVRIAGLPIRGHKGISFDLCYLIYATKRQNVVELFYPHAHARVAFDVVETSGFECRILLT